MVRCVLSGCLCATCLKMTCRSWCLQTTWSRCGWLILSPCWLSTSGLPYVTFFWRKSCLGVRGPAHERPAMDTRRQTWAGTHLGPKKKPLPFIQPLRAGGVNKQHNGTCMEAHSGSETDGHVLSAIFPPIVSPFVSNWDCYEPLNYEVLQVSVMATLFISKATTKVCWSSSYLSHLCSDRKGSWLYQGLWCIALHDPILIWCQIAWRMFHTFCRLFQVFWALGLCILSCKYFHKRNNWSLSLEAPLPQACKYWVVVWTAKKERTHTYTQAKCIHRGTETFWLVCIGNVGSYYYYIV